MSKTLPAVISAAKGGDSKRVLLIRIIPEDSGDAWDEFDWATQDITVIGWEGESGDKVFLGGVLEENAFDSIRQSVDVSEGGNVSIISGLSIRVANPQFGEDSNGDTRFDQETEDYNFENRTVEIYLAVNPDESNCVNYDDILLLYRGVVVDVEYDYKTYQIKVEDARAKRHKAIPDLVINEVDYPDCPQENLGKSPPLIYGVMAWTGYIQSDYLGQQMAIPALCIDEKRHKYIVSRAKTAEPVGNQSNFKHMVDNIIWSKCAIYDKDTDTFVPLSFVGSMEAPYGMDADVDLIHGRPTTIQFPKDKIIVATFEKQFDGIGSKTIPIDLDLSNALDEGISTYSTIGNSQKAYFTVKLPTQLFGIVEQTQIDIVILFGTITGGGTGILRYYNPIFDNGAGKFSDGFTFDSLSAEGRIWLSGVVYADYSAHGRTDDQSDQDPPGNLWGIEEINECEFGIECDADIEAQVRNISIQMRAAVVRRNAFYTRRISQPDQKAPRRRSGIGQTHILNPAPERNISIVNTLTDGDVYDGWARIGFTEDDPVFYINIIECMLRHELELTDAEINTDSFDTILNPYAPHNDGPRHTWEFSGAIWEQINSLEWIRNVVKEGCAIYFLNYENKETIRAINKHASPVKTISRDTIAEGQISVKLSDLDKVYNEFEIFKNKDQSSGNHNYREFLNATSTSIDNTRTDTPNTYTGLCADSQSRYRVTRKLILYNDWAQVSNTDVPPYQDAQLIWLAEWFCYRRWIVEFETAGLDHIDLELGDQVKIDHTLLPNAVSDTAHFMLCDISHDLNNDRMKFKFIQIPDLLP